MRVAVVILNWNGKADTLECLASLETVTYKNTFTVVADNGSSDDSIEAIKTAYPSVHILPNGENLGFAEGNNRAIRYALHKGADAILLLNNDTIVDPSFLSAFVEQNDPIQGAKLYLYSDRNRFDHLGGIWNPKKNNFDLIGCRALDNGEWETPIDLDYVCGAALFVKKEVFLTIGLLEPRYFLYWEESDFCIRGKKEGFPVRLCPKAHVWHKVSASITGGKPFVAYYWWRNRLFWLERNGSRSALLSTLFKDGTKLLRHTILLSLQHLMSSGEKKEKKKKKLVHTKACLAGVCDYLLKRF